LKYHYLEFTTFHGHVFYLKMLIRFATNATAEAIDKAMLISLLDVGLVLTDFNLLLLPYILYRFVEALKYTLKGASLQSMV